LCRKIWQRGNTVTGAGGHSVGPPSTHTDVNGIRYSLWALFVFGLFPLVLNTRVGIPHYDLVSMRRQHVHIIVWYRLHLYNFSLLVLMWYISEIQSTTPVFFILLITPITTHQSPSQPHVTISRTKALQNGHPLASVNVTHLLGSCFKLVEINNINEKMYKVPINWWKNITSTKKWTTLTS